MYICAFTLVNVRFSKIINTSILQTTPSASEKEIIYN